MARLTESALLAKCQVRWHAFFLNPDTPAQGEPYLAFMQRKFGSVEAVQDLHRRVAVVGREDGIAFDFDRMRVRPSTLAAHGLVSQVQQVGRDASVLVMEIFEAHFLRGLNIGDPVVLSRLAERCGLDGMATDVSDSRLPQRFAELTGFARALQVTGVPLFIFDGRHALSGAQPTAILDAALRLNLDDRRNTD